MDVILATSDPNSLHRCLKESKIKFYPFKRLAPWQGDERWLVKVSAESASVLYMIDAPVIPIKEDDPRYRMYHDI